MSCPCHIEMILSEKEENVERAKDDADAKVSTPLRSTALAEYLLSIPPDIEVHGASPSCVLGSISTPPCRDYPRSPVT
jgi:hypothetical protein